MRKDEILSGNPKLVGVAAGAAGVVTTTFLLPFNTLQTIMQTSGERFLSTTRTISQHGTLFGIRRLYKALRTISRIFFQLSEIVILTCASYVSTPRSTHDDDGRDAPWIHLRHWSRVEEISSVELVRADARRDVYGSVSTAMHELSLSDGHCKNKNAGGQAISEVEATVPGIHPGCSVSKFR